MAARHPSWTEPPRIDPYYASLAQGGGPGTGPGGSYTGAYRYSDYGPEYPAQQEKKARAAAAKRERILAPGYVKREPVKRESTLVKEALKGVPRSVIIKMLRTSDIAPVKELNYERIGRKMNKSPPTPAQRANATRMRTAQAAIKTALGGAKVGREIRSNMLREYFATGRVSTPGNLRPPREWYS